MRWELPSSSGRFMSSEDSFPATWALGLVGQHYSLQAGMAIFGGTYALGALAIFIARAFFFKRDHVEG